MHERGRASCEVTLVELGPEGTRGEGEMMALAGGGPHAPVAARRAAEFGSASTDGSSLTLLNVQQPDEYNTVCVSATRTSAIPQALFGSIPEKIDEEADATVAMVRGLEESATSIREAIVERLSVT